MTLKCQIEFINFPAAPFTWTHADVMCHADVIISFLQIFPNQAFVKFLC